MSDLIPEGWSETSIGELTKNDSLFNDGDWVESKDQDPNGKNRLIQLADIGDGWFINKSSRFLNDEQFERLKCTKLEKGDILVARMPEPLGRACIYPLDNVRAATIVDIAIIRTPNADHKWLTSAINSSDYRSNIELNASGTTRTRIARGALAKLKLLAPPLPEQQKIAAILTSVDEVIEKTQAQIDKLKDLKTGMMQTLLTKGVGIDGKPHTEFKDSPVGRIPKGWGVVNLIEIANNLDSKRVPIKSVDRASMQGQYRYYGASGVIDYVDDYIFDGEFILLGEDGENVISRNSPLAFIVKGKFWVNNHAHVLTPKENMNIRFLCEYLEFLDYKNIASGSAQPKITKGALNTIKIPVPELSEQIRIGDILKSIDDKSIKVISKSEMLRATKKALMQDLLTGKVRVNVSSEATGH